MAYGGDTHIMQDMRDNLKELKMKMIDMAHTYVKDADELEEYIDRVERILRI